MSESESSGQDAGACPKCGDNESESLGLAVRGWVTCLACGHMWPLGANFSSPEAVKREEKSKLRVLVADDDEEGRRAMASAIRSLGVEVDVAIDGLDALDAFRQLTFDLVLIDYSMPRMNGVEAVAGMRALAAQRQPRVPILVFSSRVDEPMHRDCLQAGADLVLDKGIGLDRIRTVVAAHLRPGGPPPGGQR